MYKVCKNLYKLLNLSVQHIKMCVLEDQET